MTYACDDDIYRRGMKKEREIMKKIFVAVATLMIIGLSAVYAYPPSDEAWTKCATCHRLDRKEAEKIVNKFVKGGRLMEIQPGPLKGFWMLEIERDGKRGGLLLDFSKTYVVGQMAPVRPPERKVDFSRIPLSDAVVMGQVNAKRKVVVFTDPDCPFCRKLHDEIKKVIAKRSDIVFYLILFPLDRQDKDAYNKVYKKVQAILCERSLSLADDAFAGKSLLEPKCGNEAVERSKALARSLDISGTPAIIKDQGVLISGYLEAADLIEWIDKK